MSDEPSQSDRPAQDNPAPQEPKPKEERPTEPAHEQKPVEKPSVENPPVPEIPIQVNFAPFRLRVGALVIDLLILVPGLLIGMINFFGLLFASDNFLNLTIVLWLIQIYLIYRTRATLGKKIFRLKVLSEDGNKPSFIRILLRESFGKLVSTAHFGLGFFWSIWDQKHQTWHDKIFRTQVISDVTYSDDVRSNYYLMGFMIFLQYLFFLVPLFLALIFSITLMFQTLYMVYFPLKAEVLNRQITKYSQKAVNSDWLCSEKAGYCETDSRMIDNNEWIRHNFSYLEDIEQMKLPPRHEYLYYRYCSDGQNWEIQVLPDITKIRSNAVKVTHQLDFLILSISAQIAGFGNELIYTTGNSFGICNNTNLFK